MGNIGFLPEYIKERIILDEFHKENLKIYFVRNILQLISSSYVVTYKRNRFRKDISMTRHLCGNISGARLNNVQLVCLKIAEAIVKKDNASFCIYQKPIMRI